MHDTKHWPHLEEKKQETVESEGKHKSAASVIYGFANCNVKSTKKEKMRIEGKRLIIWIIYTWHWWPCFRCAVT
jgi:hypothetical protein